MCSLFLIAVALFRVVAANKRCARTARLARRAIGRAFLIAVPGLLLPLLIRYFVVSGIATATEVSVVGILYTLLVGVFVYRDFELARRSTRRCVDTVVAHRRDPADHRDRDRDGLGAHAIGFRAAARDGARRRAGRPRSAIMLLSIVLFIVLGSVLEGIPAMVLFGPLLFPVAKAAGINEVHYAIVAVLAMGIGLFAPPLGVGFFSAARDRQSRSRRGVRPILPYLGALLAACS